MQPVQSGYLSYQLAPLRQEQTATQEKTEDCHLCKLRNDEILIIMKKLDDKSRANFVMTCKRVYNIFKVAAVHNPLLDHRLRLEAHRTKNVAYNAIEKFKGIRIVQQLLFTGMFFCADLAFVFIFSSGGCCSCTPSAAATLALQYAGASSCGLSCVHACALCILPCCEGSNEQHLIKTYNEADEILHLVKTNRGIKSQPQKMKMNELSSYQLGNSESGDAIYAP